MICNFQCYLWIIGLFFFTIGAFGTLSAVVASYDYTDDETRFKANLVSQTAAINASLITICMIMWILWPVGKYLLAKYNINFNVFPLGN